MAKDNQFEAGVQYYTRGTIRIGWPEDQVNCKWCPMLKAEMGGLRYRCFCTGEILYNLDRVGSMCPVENIEADKPKEAAEAWKAGEF